MLKRLLKFIYVIHVLAWLFCTQHAKAQTPFLLSDKNVQYRLDKNIDVFIDSTNQLPFQVVQTKPFKSSSGNLTFGYLKETIWLKVNTQAASPTTEWYLEIPAPFLEFVDFYQKADSGWQHNLSGYYRPQSIRVISHTSHALPLLFGQDSTSTVYIKIAGQSPKTFPVYVQEKEAFLNQVRLEDIGYGIFFGILIVMFFYNLIIYFTLRQINYLLYVFTIVCTFSIFITVSGYAGKFLWPNNPELNFYAGRMSLPILTLFLVPFTYRFLEVPKYSRVMGYILLSLIPFAIAAAILIATGIMSSAANTLILVSTVVSISTGIVCRIQGNKNATFFIAAWTAYLLGGLLLTLRNSAVLDFNFWTTHFVEIGAALETVLIAFALAYQYSALKLDKEKAQAFAITLQRETNEALELKVRERTEQLSKANHELTLTLDTVKHQSRLIEDKNAELDGFFYRVSHDLKGPISTLQGLYYLSRMEVKDVAALEYLERNNQQVQRLNTIISGLIQLAKLNGQPLNLQPIQFDKLIDDCLASAEDPDKQKTIEVHKKIEPGIKFNSEWTLLNAIVQNLLENAIKYSSEHGPIIQIAVYRNESGVVIQVKDNGPGIPQEHHTRIFEMFYRATNNAQGNGLGLYILKRSVDRLKGTVAVSSQVGEGTEFTVVLPDTIQ